MYKNIILNIPHSSDIMPVNTWDGDIQPHILRWTDKYTDVLFKPIFKDIQGTAITPVIFPVSRFFCDAERLINDPLGEVGQGIYYTKFEDCTRTPDEYTEKYVKKLWSSHQEMLSSLITDNTIIIDCHSFPSDVADVDVCIGYNEDWSKPSDGLVNAVKTFFEGYGLTVDINNPYSNSITPKSDKKYTSFMIELNKRLYLMSDNTTMKPCAYKFGFMLNYLYNKLLQEWNF